MWRLREEQEAWSTPLGHRLPETIYMYVHEWSYRVNITI